jgi:hypothetical protein
MKRRRLSIRYVRTANALDAVMLRSVLCYVCVSVHVEVASGRAVHARDAEQFFLLLLSAADMDAPRSKLSTKCVLQCVLRVGSACRACDCTPLCCALVPFSQARNGLPRLAGRYMWLWYAWSEVARWPSHPAWL